jgi:hypothetical protein
MSRPKKDSKEFAWIRIGGWLILSRLSKGIKHVDPAGKPNGWVRLGGLGLSDDKCIKATIGAFDVDTAKATIEPTPTSDPLTSVWFLAGAKIGETYMSYDKQPKLNGPMDTSVYIARIKRNDDFDTTVHYWKKWLEWRQEGASESFDVFVFGERSASRSQSPWDVIFQIESHIARVRALKQRMQVEYGLSLKQEPTAGLNPETASKSEAKTPRKKTKSRQT